MLDDIEMFYNPKRKHTNNVMLSQVDFDIRQQNLNKSDVWETKGTSGQSSHYFFACCVLAKG